MDRRWFRPCLTLVGLASLFAHTLALASQRLDDSEPGSGAPASTGGVFIDNRDLEMDDLDDPSLDTERSGTERITNTFSVQAGPAFRKGLGFDLELGWHLDEDRLIELRVGQYKAKNVEGFSEFDMQNVIVQSKIFMSNSLYFSIGAGYATIEAKAQETLVNSSSSVDTYAYKGSLNQGLLAIAAGNQWQSGMWSWGVDWFKVFLPFSLSLDTSRVETTGTGADQQRLMFENKLKREAWNIDFGVGVYGGYVF